MPIFIKPRVQVCRERSESDAIFYYDYFAKFLVETNDEEKNMETRQELVRLYKWIELYKEFSFNFHLKNFTPSGDLYLRSEDAITFGPHPPPPRAPFIEVFEEIPNGNN